MKIKVSQLKTNPNNPRVIRDHHFKKLVKSIKDFPEMLSVRKIVCTPDFVILGGNMRLKALQEAGIKEVDVEIVDWDESQQKQFIIKDNLSYGEWDWEMLANEWDDVELTEWGLEIFQKADDVDYSILEEDDLAMAMEEMRKNVKKAIQIEFEIDDYPIADELITYFREKNIYIGGLLIEKLREVKARDV